MLPVCMKQVLNLYLLNQYKPLKKALNCLISFLFPNSLYLQLSCKLIKIIVTVDQHVVLQEQPILPYMVYVHSARPHLLYLMLKLGDRIS